MKAAFLALSLLGHPLAPVSDRLPSYDVEALCDDVSADDKASGLANDASKCVSDETAAKQQLASIWLTVPAARVKAAKSWQCQEEDKATSISLPACKWQARSIRPRQPRSRSKERARIATPQNRPQAPIF